LQSGKSKARKLPKTWLLFPVVPVGEKIMLVVRSYSPTNLVRLLPKRIPSSIKRNALPVDEVWSKGLPQSLPPVWPIPTRPLPESASLRTALTPAAKAEAIDPFYLFACYAEWQRSANPSAAWELIAASRASHSDARPQALALLEHIQEFTEPPLPASSSGRETSQNFNKESGMRAPYGLEVIESCMGCKASRGHFFCRFSPSVLRSVDAGSYHSVMPSGALLFVEGQSPRGVYVLCSGKVKLSTTSKDGKVLILKQAEAGEVLGLSAAVSGTNYEMTAETSTPCQLNFIGRQDLMALLQNESEVGVRASQALSREFQAAYRDIHDLVLARSSSGKLARLLLSCAPHGPSQNEELRVHSLMTHEEMAQRIGASRETVTRLLSSLKRRKLIRIEGATLVIRNRNSLEAIAI
jgi:CRP/FNR family transcriptional regulator